MSAAALPTVTLGSLVTGDTGSFSETYGTKNVGTSLTLTPAGTVADGNSGNNYAITWNTDLTGAITTRSITVTAATNGKTYDGTMSASALPTVTSGSLASGDSGSFSETYGTKNVGTSLTLTPAGAVADGNSGNNYAITWNTDLTGAITARSITVTAATNGKTYDGTMSASALPTVTSGSLATGDTGSFSETYGTKNVGTGLTLTPAGTVADGNSGNNYAITWNTDLTGAITARSITVTAATNGKTYDGTMSASALPTVTSGSLATGDTGSFSETYGTKNVGTGLTLTPAGTVADGNSGNNYAITWNTDLTGAITTRAITVTAATNGKTYDGTMSAAALPTVTLGSLVTGDTGSFSETYGTKNVGTSLTLTPAGTVADGNSGNNYAITWNTDLTGAITTRAITVTAATNGKTYDGTTSASALPTVTLGSLATGDTGSFSETYGTKNVGTGLTLTPTGTVLDGNSGNNYAITWDTNLTGAISKAQLTITAGNQNIVYGAVVPGDTLAYSGFIRGENSSNLNSPPVIASAQSGIANAGIYAGNYTVSGASGNYVISYVSGNLTVLPRSLTVVTDSQTIYAGRPNPVFTGSNNLLAQDAPLINWSYAPVGYSGTAGTYPIAASANDPQNRLANYVVSDIEGAFTVNPMQIPMQIPSTVVMNSQQPAAASSAYNQPSYVIASGNAGSENGSVGNVIIANDNSGNDNNINDNSGNTPSTSTSGNGSVPYQLVYESGRGRYGSKTNASFSIEISPALQQLLGIANPWEN
jgi:hypothetical protein